MSKAKNKHDSIFAEVREFLSEKERSEVTRWEMAKRMDINITRYVALDSGKTKKCDPATLHLLWLVSGWSAKRFVEALENYSL